MNQVYSKNENGLNTITVVKTPRRNIQFINLSRILQSFSLLLLWLGLGLAGSRAYGQTCGTTVNAPTTINGISVTGSGTGSVALYAPPFASCDSSVVVPPNSLYLGNGSGSAAAFTYTYTFSQPVNNMVLVFAATGAISDEVFTFTTNGGGTPQITSPLSCFSTINRNVLSSGAGAPNLEGGGGFFEIYNASGPYTTLTISGPGGNFGSLVALCSSSPGFNCPESPLTISPAAPSAINPGATNSFSVTVDTLRFNTYAFAQTNTTVTNPNNSLGVDNGTFATLDASTDRLNLDFGSTFAAGTPVTARMSSSTAGSVTATLSFSTDGTNYANPTIVTVTGTTLTNYTLSLPVAARYIRITRSGSTPVLRVDAVWLQSKSVPALTWAISPTTGVSPSSGTGTSTGTVTFNNAGSYTVTFTATNSTFPMGCVSPGISTVSATQCITPPVPTISTTAATCSAAGTATVSNYDANITYTFDPVGPSVGAGGSISNITYGQAYTVIASSASNCASIASLSFFVNDKFSCYPDINVAFVNQQVSGNLSTNDDLATGTVYGTASAVSGNPSGATLTMSNTGDGTYTFTATEPGVYNYTVEVCSIGQTPGQNPSQCASSVLTITVLDDGSITNPPVTNTDVAMVDGYAAAGTPTSVVINVLSNDFAGDLVGSLDPAEVTIINQPANGTVTVNNDGTITYVPDADFVGTDVFIYEVCDTKVPAECAEAMVEVTVTAPTATGVQAADDYVNTNGTAPVAGNLLDNDIDFATNGNSVLSVTPLVITNSDYTLTINADGSYVFEAEPGFDGPANFVYEVCNSDSPDPICTEATFYITVTNHITYDATNGWVAGSNGDEKPNTTDGNRNVYVLEGTTPVVDIPVTISNLYVASGAELQIGECLTVNDGSMIDGKVRFVANNDGSGVGTASYGRYVGASMQNTIFEMILSEKGWHNIAIPVRRANGDPYTAAEFMADNNDTVGDNELVNLTGDPLTHNLWWYDSEVASGREQGFFINRSVTSGTVPGFGSSTYQTHAYGTWKMILSTDLNLNRYGMNYFIDDYFSSTFPRKIQASGTVNDASLTLSTHDNWGGWNLIPNPFPTVLDVYKLNGEGAPSIFHRNGNTSDELEFDRAIWIWNPGDPYSSPIPGMFSTGAYVAVDAQTGQAVTNINNTVLASDTLIAPFQSFYIRRITGSEVRREEFGGGALDSIATNEAVGPTQTTPGNDGSTYNNDAERTSIATNGPLNVTIHPDHRGGCAIIKHYKKEWDLMMVYAIDEANPTLGDATELVFDDSYTNGYDVGYDIQKLGNKKDAPVLFTRLEKRALVINKMAYPEQTTSVPMGFYAEISGKKYRIELPKVPAGWRVYLEDRLTGKWHDLVYGGAYSFTNRTDVAMERFILHFSMKSEAIAPIKPEARAWGYENGIEVSFTNIYSPATITVTNMVGQVIYHQEKVSTAENHYIQLRNGEAAMYVVRVVTEEVTNGIKVVR